jgi:hypothetical protein
VWIREEVDALDADVPWVSSRPSRQPGSADGHLAIVAAPSSRHVWTGTPLEEEVQVSATSSRGFFSW